MRRSRVRGCIQPKTADCGFRLSDREGATPRVSIVIPSLSFDGGALTAKAIESVERTKDSLAVETIVVDDASRDGSGPLLKDRFPHIRLIRNESGRGFTGANNQGLEAARGEYLLMLNNDAELLPGCLQLMVGFLDEHPDVGVVGPKLLLTDEPDRLDSAITHLLPFGYVQYMGWRGIDNPAESDPVRVFTVKGACALVRVDLVRRYGFLIEDYFAYFEETELCWRLWLLGYESVYLPGARALHGLGKTTLRLPSAFLDYNVFKNRLATSLSHFEMPTLLAALPAHAAVLCGAVLFYVLRGRFANAAAVVRAVGWNIKRFRQTQRWRASVQAMRVISDSKLMKDVGTKLSLFGFLRHAFHYGTRA